MKNKPRLSSRGTQSPPTIAKRTFFVGLALALALTACHRDTPNTVSAPLPSPRGTYLVAGGYASVRFPESGAAISSPNHSYCAYAKDGRLRLIALSHDGQDLRTFAKMDLTPSTATFGDWDLVAYKETWLGRPLVKVTVVPGVVALDTTESLFTLRQPVPSFLHRIDDSKIEDYFKCFAQAFPSREGPAVSAPLVGVAAQLVSNHPGDLWVEGLYLQALALDQQLDPLKREIDRYGEAYRHTSNFYHQHAFRFAQHNLKMLELNRQGKNAYAYFMKLMYPRANLEKTYETWLGFTPFDNYMVPLCVRSYIPDFFEYQSDAKIMVTLSELMMLQGQRREALDLMTAVYRLGQVMNQAESTLITKLVGIAIRGIAQAGLELFMLNACETPSEMAQFSDRMKDLANRYRAPTSEQMFEMESGALGWGLYEDPIIKPNFVEAMTRQTVADARFEVLRLAAVIRGALLQTGQFPSNIGSLGDFLPIGVGRDPFTSEALHYVTSPSEAICYSLGPDKADDGGQITYDPTNGTISRGDVFLKVPRERQYPFPAEGLHAATAADVARQFPKGLPRDLFAYSKVPLSISDSQPVYIYSVGPDHDEKDRPQGYEHYPEPLYDPTNGVSSKGDLVMEIKP